VLRDGEVIGIEGPEDLDVLVDVEAASAPFDADEIAAEDFENWKDLAEVALGFRV